MKSNLTIWGGFKLGIGIWCAMFFIEGVIDFALFMATIIMRGLGFQPPI